MTAICKRFTATIVLALAAAVAAPGTAAAHGEAEPGPHGGEIRMPGAFHVEAVAGDGALRVYLLDMQFENPRVADSSVEAKLEQGGRAWQLDCRAREATRRFECPLPSGAELEAGTLTIDAARAGVPGAAARYGLPLLQGGDTDS